MFKPLPVPRFFWRPAYQFTCHPLGSNVHCSDPILNILELLSPLANYSPLPRFHRNSKSPEERKILERLFPLPSLAKLCLPQVCCSFRHSLPESFSAELFLRPVTSNTTHYFLRIIIIWIRYDPWDGNCKGTEDTTVTSLLSSQQLLLLVTGHVPDRQKRRHQFCWALAAKILKRD